MVCCRYLVFGYLDPWGGSVKENRQFGTRENAGVLVLQVQMLQELGCFAIFLVFWVVIFFRASRPSGSGIPQKPGPQLAGLSKVSVTFS